MEKRERVPDKKRTGRSKKQKKSLKIWLELAAVLVIAATAVLLFVSNRNLSTEDLREGVSYIKTLEAKNVSEVENSIKEMKKAERKAAFESGEVEVWSQFNDAVIMGDSRAVGFYFYEFVDTSRVLAEGGATIRDIPNYLDTLALLNPSSIFLCYGLNDISIGYWNTVEEYIAELDQVLETLKTTVPNAVIYVNSTIPAVDPAFQTAEIWRKIPDWNVVIKQHCEEQGIAYVDINATVEAHMDLYDPDGIHMMREFYEFWAIDMITEVYENE